MDMKVVTGEISPASKTQYKGPSLMLLPRPSHHINDIIHTESKEVHILYRTPPRNDDWVGHLASGDVPPETHGISPLISLRTAPFDTATPAQSHLH